MKLLTGRFVIALSVSCLVACSHHRDSAPTEQPATTSRVSHHTETFTGEVVKRNGEYCFKLLSEPQPETGPTPASERILRLTRAGDAKEFASDEIHLRKYYGKTIVVKGHLDQDWIAKADVVGQWLRPGQPRGATLIGPEPTN